MSSKKGFLQETNSKREKIALWVLSFVLLAINAIRIFNDSISGDEGFSIRLAKDSVAGMIQATANDVHPPLYYLIFQLFSKIIGTSAPAAKLVTFVAVILAVVLANTYIRKRFGTYAAAFLVVLLTFNVTGIEMIVEARMYTWAMLFVTLTAIFGYELLRKANKGKWIGLLLFGLAAGYTHYYALIMVAFIYAVTFVALVVRSRKNLLPCVICSVCAIIGYLPWLLILLQQFGSVSSDYWINSIELKEWIRYIFGHDRFGKLLRILLVLSGAIYLFTKDGLQVTHNLVANGGLANRKLFVRFDFTGLSEEDRNERIFVLMCGITVVGTLAVATIVSYLFRPLYVERYMYSAFGLIALAFGICFSGVCRKKRYALILLMAIILVGVNSYHIAYQREAAYQTEEAKAFFAEQLAAEDIFVTDNSQLSWTVLDYYFPMIKNYALADFDFFTQNYRVVWYFSDKPELDERILDYEKQGLQVEYVEDSGLGRYSYSLYKITK